MAKNEIRGVAVRSFKASWPVNAKDIISNTSDYPENVRNAVRWLFNHSMQSRYTFKEAAKKIGYDHTTLSRVMRGVYGRDGNAGNVGNVLEVILTYRL